MLGGVLYAHYNVGDALPGRLEAAGLGGNLALVILALVVVINIPMAVPSNRVKKEDIVGHTHEILSDADFFSARVYQCHQKIILRSGNG